MKIVVTGSLGNISKTLAIALIQNGHQVTIISSNLEKQKDIETLGAISAIGNLENVDFLTNTFMGADAVYCMVPPVNFFDPNYDVISNYTQIGKNYYEAILKSGVKNVVHLSSIGAHLDNGTGIILGHHSVENILKDLPNDISITTIRPTAFYLNLLGYIGRIKNAGMITANYGGEDVIPWVSPIDIANIIAEEIVQPMKGRTIKYVVSDELSCSEAASILGRAINMPALKWQLITDEQMQNSLVAIGMAAHSAAGLVEMNASMHNGIFMEDYYKNKPKLGSIKLQEFANDFAQIFKK
jgi:uncharacterized protein YbjT (DUF2867 family)